MNKILSLLLFRIHVELGMPYPRRQRSQVSSMGTIFLIPDRRISSWQDDGNLAHEMFNIPALIFPAFFLKPKLLGRYNAIRNLPETTLWNFSCESR